MKFGHLFEFHKIPDWYTEYVHYRELKLRISEFKALTKAEQVKKLKGYYMINKRGQIYCIDFIKDNPTQNDQRKMKRAKSSNDKTAMSQIGNGDKLSALVPTMSSNENSDAGGKKNYMNLSHGKMDFKLIEEEGREGRKNPAPQFGPIRSSSADCLAEVYSTSPKSVELGGQILTRDGTARKTSENSQINTNSTGHQSSHNSPPDKIIKPQTQLDVQDKRKSERIVTESMRQKQQAQTIIQKDGKGLEMDAIIEENLEFEMDEEDIKEKQILGNLLASKMEKDTKENGSQITGAASRRQSYLIPQESGHYNSSLIDGSQNAQDLTVSLLSAGSTKDPMNDSKSEINPNKTKNSRPETCNVGAQSNNRLLTQSEMEDNRISLDNFDLGLENMANLIPDLKKKDMENMMPDERDELMQESERLSIEWIHAFLDEVYRIDDFFISHQKELINNFIGLQDKFRVKTEHYEVGSTKTGKSKKSKASRGGTEKPRSLSPINRSDESSPNLMSPDLVSPRLERRTQPNLDQGGMSNPRTRYMENPADVGAYDQAANSFDRNTDSQLLKPQADFDRMSQMTGKFSAMSKKSEQSNLIDKQARYKNVEDLQKMLGQQQLESYIVPEMKEISEQIRRKKISVTNKTETKDAFDQMVNWKRVFEQIWQQIRWLISFGQINELALRKILKKYVKNFFVIKDNTINKKLSQIINEMSFKMEEGKMTRELQILSDDLLTFYADCFCKGNVQMAKRQLDAQYNEIRRKDSNLISFFGGGLLIQFSFFLFLCIIPPADGLNNWSEIYASTDTYYFTLLICFILFSTGFAVQIFRRYNINYTFIFEIDQHYKLIHHQLYRIAMIFTFIWFLCFTWQVAMVKLAPEFNDSHVQYFSIILLVIFLAFCIMPVHCFYMKARVVLAKTLWNILISPFGKVRFRHFFLADVITSMTGPLQHLMIIACYYKDSHFIDGQIVDLKGECSTAYGFYWAMAFLPYWWRFAQCLNKYHETEARVHLLNAGKYFSCLVAPVFLYFAVKSDFTESGTLKYERSPMFWTYFAAMTFRTAYCYVWDIYMDWGLLRQNEKGKPNRFLREKINYAPYFYYWAIFSDFVLRFIFIFFLYNFGTKGSFFNQVNLMFAISMFCEAFRRAQWALLRVENEQNNNLESYRTIPIIPPIINSSDAKTGSTQQN